MRHSIHLCLLAVLLLSLVLTTVKVLAAPAHPGAARDFSYIDTYVEDQMRSFHVPGLALAIVEGDQVSYLKGYGTAGSGRPVTPQTPFMIGSNGKSITALAVMQLVEAGKIELDEKVQAYLPWFTLAHPQAAEKITVRMLLGHISGLPAASLENRQVLDDVSAQALENQVRVLKNVQPAHQPGTTFEYSNANYDTLGLIVQVASGQPYQDYLVEHIFEPLDMKNSHTLHSSALSNGLSQGYRYWFGYPLPLKHLPFSLGSLPSGHQMLSAEDFAHYLVAHLNDGRYQDAQVLSADGIKTTHTPILAGYAMGWVADGGLLSHNGSVPSFGSSMLLDPARKLGIAVMWNVNTGGGFAEIYDTAYNIQRLLTGRALLPERGNASYEQFQILLLIGLGMLAGWVALSLALLRRWGRRSGSAVKARIISGVSSLLTAGLSMAIIYLLASQQRSLAVLYMFAPDLTIVSLVLITALVGWAVIFPTLVQTNLSRSEAETEMVGAPVLR